MKNEQIYNVVKFCKVSYLEKPQWIKCGEHPCRTARRVTVSISKKCYHVQVNYFINNYLYAGGAGLLFLRWDGDLKEVSAETSQVGAAGDSPKCPTE